jgi:DNA-binding GntR family transcriptional regulator
MTTEPDIHDEADQALRRTSLPELIYLRLREEIANGKIQPGPLRLRPLATRFGTSQIPVREALRRLEAERLVSFDDNRAIIVNAVSAAGINEIFAIRVELECLALRLASPQLAGDPGRLADLERLIAQMDAEEDEPMAWRRTNERFHRELYQAAKAPRLLSMIDTLWVAVEPYLRIYLASSPNLARAQAEHRALLEQIRESRGREAEDVLRQQLTNTRDLVLRFLENPHAATGPRRPEAPR